MKVASGRVFSVYPMDSPPTKWALKLRISEGPASMIDRLVIATIDGPELKVLKEYFEEQWKAEGRN